MGNPNGNQLQIQHAVGLSIRFRDAQYQVTLLVADLLCCPIYVIILFLNWHIEQICCTRDQVQINRG